MARERYRPRPTETAVFRRDAWDFWENLGRKVNLTPGEQTALGYLTALHFGLLEPLVELPDYQTPTGATPWGDFAQIARIREVSREAVHKHVRSLREKLHAAGYQASDFFD